MKSGIHPDYVECTVTCGCGNVFKTRATVPAMNVEICGVCHPFYTGQQKYVDTAGRIERFQRKFGGSYFRNKKEKGAGDAASKA
jgi:large subunit ribosomal protein L31